MSSNVSSNLGLENVWTSEDLSYIPRLRNISCRGTKVKFLYLVSNVCKRPILWSIATAPIFRNLVENFCFAFYCLTVASKLETAI